MFNKEYAKYYDLFNSSKPYKKEINFVYKWANEPKWILDIGCGTANYWKYYPRSVKLCGLDRSKEMISKSKHKNIIYGDITKIHHLGNFECVTALFDVINYIPNHDWWSNLPLDKGGFFIFDIWDKKKVDVEGFSTSIKMKNGMIRTIELDKYDGKNVSLNLEINAKDFHFKETHNMYLHSHKDIKKYCGNSFEIVDIKPTEKWQTWYKCRKK